MKSSLLGSALGAAALTFVPAVDALAEGGKATIEKIKCGPANWHNPTCPGCKAADGKMHVTTKYVEAAIADAHEAFAKELLDPQKEIDALAAVTRDLRPGLAPHLGHLVRRFFRMLTDGGRADRPNCYEHYHPMNGRPSVCSSVTPSP